SPMFVFGLRFLAIGVLASVVGAQTVQLHNCAKMILITGKFWPCIVWQRPLANTTAAPSITSSSSTEAPTTTTTEEVSVLIETTSSIPSTTQEATKRMGKTTRRVVPTTTVEETTIGTTRRIPSTTERSTTEERMTEETATEPSTSTQRTTTEKKARRVKGMRGVSESTTTMRTTERATTEEEKSEEEEEENENATTERTTTVNIPTTTTEDVEIKVVTKKGKESSSSNEESVELEELIGVAQSTTPPPYFVTLLTDRSRDEFYRIAKNPFLTKAELLYRIRRWATRQPNLVREAIFDIEHELIRQQSSVRKEAAAILEALPLAFTQYTNIRDNVALTKQEEQEDFDSLFKAMPRKTAKTLRYVLMMAGDSMEAKKEEQKLRRFSLHSFRSTIRDTLG
ncbi:hypothetical protein PFISCL1PPCAC_14810, partial [Pristionchus fissidentatus]